MSIVTLEEVTIGYRGPLLLDQVSCRIDPGERIGLLGRNGAGKTTLMRMLSGSEEPDSGKIILSRDTHVGLLQQDVPQDLVASIQEVVATGWREEDADESQSWKMQTEVDKIVTRMELDPEARFENLSSGMKRRVLLAKTLVSKPDLLLLDEPTNHLDIEAIDWLEKFLAKWQGAFMFVTHDRMFLRKMANRILEIDRGQLFDWTCDYDTFLTRKEQALAAEEKQNALFDKKLAEEEAWIRQGIKARRTRNEGRVRALKALRLERAGRRDISKTSNLTIQEGQKSGMLVLEAEEIHFGYGAEQKVIDDFSITVMRGDKVGVIGPNGCGKSTLVKLLLGKLEPQAGQVKLGTNLEIAYFDQLREQLDPEKTVVENVGDGYEHVNIGDQKKHIIGYLQEFLFSSERARTAVKFLSGGERNRILLAKLFTKTANLIILDEPTNDLDTETLEMLEQRLVDFNGTVIVISHDREFLNNVVTTSIVFERGGIKEYVGGYDDWVRQRPAEVEAEPVVSKPRPAKKEEKPNTSGSARKLKYSERLELEKLPSQIENKEGEIAVVHEEMADPAFYQQDGNVIAEKQKQLNSLDEELAGLYARWEELEELASES